MRALVTGASGFIGALVVRALMAEGHQVIGVSRSIPPPDGLAAPAILWLEADLLKAQSADRLMQAAKPDALVHLAWETKHGEFWTSPANAEWLSATLELARAFAAAGGQRFVGLGSCAEYSWDGLRHGEAISETSPCTPHSVYGASKSACFEQLRALFPGGRVSFAWGRLFFPYGPGDCRPALVPQVIRSLLAGEPALTSAGIQVRDFIYVDDAARAIASLVSAEASGAFNICTGVGVAVAEMASRVATAAGRLELLRTGALAVREGDPGWLVGSPQRIASETGWRARTPLDEGIRETLRWWRERTTR